MEVILDCVFEQVFGRLDRGCLLARFKRRQLVDYIGTVIRGSSANNPQAGCAQAVKAAIRMHRSSREDNNQICLMGKYHHILYVAATLAFEWRLEDHNLVGELLQEIFICEQTFEKLLIGAILGNKVTHLITGWKCDFKNREECLLAAQYFLEQAAKADLIFDSRDEIRRMVNVPMESYGGITPLRMAAQTGQADSVALFLQYGAQITFDPMDRNTCALQPLLNTINNLCYDNPGPTMPVPPHMILSLNLLLRELPMLPDLLHDPEDENPRELHPRVLSLMPPQRTGLLIVPCLKHMCRCVIRQQMRDDGLLPHGVPKLPLPSVVTDFINFKPE